MTQDPVVIPSTYGLPVNSLQNMEVALQSQLVSKSLLHSKRVVSLVKWCPLLDSLRWFPVSFMDSTKPDYIGKLLPIVIALELNLHVIQTYSWN